jgi:hypothetical protein
MCLRRRYLIPWMVAHRITPGNSMGRSATMGACDPTYLAPFLSLEESFNLVI